jgi:hypothetical protein
MSQVMGVDGSGIFGHLDVGIASLNDLNDGIVHICVLSEPELSGPAGYASGGVYTEGILGIDAGRLPHPENAAGIGS